MENMRRIRGIVEKNYSRQSIYEDFQPSSDWTHDSNAHVLLVDVPGFKKEEVKLQVDKLGRVSVSGERWVSENKYSRFKQVFSVPEDSDIDKISGRFEAGLLFVIIPKKEAEKEHQAVNEIEEEKKHEALNKEKKLKKDDLFDGKHDHDHEEPKKEHQSAEQIQEGKKQEVSDNEEKAKEDDFVDDKHGHDHDHEEPKKEHQGANEIQEEKKQEITNNEENLKKDDFDDGKDDHDHKHGIGKKKKEECQKNGGKEVLNKEKEGNGIKDGLEVGLMESLMEMINKNKEVIVTAVLAISIGLFLSHKLRSRSQ